VHPELRHAAASLLQRAIRADAALFSIYADTSARLEAAGYRRQVHKGPTQTLLFYQRDKRIGIRHSDDSGSFVYEGNVPATTDQLCAAIQRRPEDFSANVLLRPIIQNALFPTLGVVLGPAETAYYAQLGGMHDYFGVPRPAVMPRTSVTLLDRRVVEQVSQLGVDLGCLGKNLEGEISRVLQTRFPNDLKAALEESADKIAATFDELRPKLHQFDPSLDSALRIFRKRAAEQVALIARKVRAKHRHGEKETESRIRFIAQCLFPAGVAQERTFNIVYYWAQYGSRLLDEYYRHWPAGRREHLIWDVH
jgi:uncharacterized protein YllA (UPF0747 family)